MDSLEVAVGMRSLLKEDYRWFAEVRSSARSVLHDSTDFSFEEVTEWMKSNSHRFRLVTLENRPIGYFRTSGVEYVEGQKLLWIGLDLASDFRGKGLGRVCYEHLAPIVCREFTADGMILRVLNSNVRAFRLYLNLGFRVRRVFVQMGESGCEPIDWELVKTDAFKGGEVTVIPGPGPVRL